MKGYAITIFVSVLALSSYAWDRSNTHTNYFIDTSTTISENLAPTKNIHINDGSTPKSVDFNERRRIGQGPSIDNFQSFYSRRLGVVLASSCGGSLL